MKAILGLVRAIFCNMSYFIQPSKTVITLKLFKSIKVIYFFSFCNSKYCHILLLVKDKVLFILNS